jgi:serine/threonine-protein kinase
MGEVWLASSRGPGNFCKKVVIKTVRPELAEQTSYVTMLINEASLVARLHHPNIVQVFDLACVDGLYYIAMEYVPGCTLSELLQRFAQVGRPIPQWAALHLAATCCDGLQYAHDFREDDGTPVCILHRDISPSNIMITPTGNVVVLDFGVATAASGPERTRTGTLKGKYSYMAPERVNGADADRRSDVYSVGVVLYQLLTGGHRPYCGDNEYQLLKAIIQGKAKPPSSHYHHVPPDVDAVTMRAIAHDPVSRYSEARYLSEALRALSLRRQWNYGASDLGQLIADLVAATGPLETPSPTPQESPVDDLGTLVRDLPRGVSDGPSEVSFEIITETEDSSASDESSIDEPVDEPVVEPDDEPPGDPINDDAIPRHIARTNSTRPNIFPEPTQTRPSPGDVFGGYIRADSASEADRWPWGNEQ